MSLRYPLYALAAAGIGINFVSLHGAPLAALWSVAPYLLVVALTVFSRVRIPLFFAAFAMLFVDVWLYGEILFNTKSPVLLAMSLLSTLKLVIIFPVGLLIGFLANRYFKEKYSRRRSTERRRKQG